MFSLSHMVDLLANEFSCLGRRGLTLTGIFLSSLDALTLWHGITSKSASEYRFGNATGQSTVHCSESRDIVYLKNRHDVRTHRTRCVLSQSLDRQATEIAEVMRVVSLQRAYRHSLLLDASVG